MSLALTAKEFRFSRTPWTINQPTPAALGPWTRILLGMKPGESKDLLYRRYKGLMSAAYRHSIPVKSEKVSKAKWRLTRLG